MAKSKGRVTIPTDMDVVKETLEIMNEWGADAIRDCDGTEFPQELRDTGAKVYATYYTTRKDNAWAKANPDEIQQMYIMTKFHTATSDTLSILGALRLIVAKELDIIPEGKWNFLWITEMPFFEYDEEKHLKSEREIWLAEGTQAGIEKGIASEIVSMGLECGLSKEQVLHRLQAKLNISEQTAKEYFDKYSKEPVRI